MKLLAMARVFIFKKKLVMNGSGFNLQLEFDYDDEYISEVIGLMEKDINKDPVDGKLEMVSSGKFNIIPDKKGTSSS